MKQNLQEKYLPQSYRNKLLDQWNNLKQGNKSINEYIIQFNDYMMRCAIKENEAMTFIDFVKVWMMILEEKLYFKVYLPLTKLVP
jgi:hypothetical protein